MITSNLSAMFERDLKALQKEISAYQADTNMWKVVPGISNSGGNLCLHLIGNLKWFVGAQLGNTGYVRQRTLEFSAKDVPRDVILREVDETRELVVRVLGQIESETLEAPFPIEVFGYEMTTGYFLTHLVTHLAYHLGQINYHRRILEG